MTPIWLNEMLCFLSGGFAVSCGWHVVARRYDRIIRKQEARNDELAGRCARAFMERNAAWRRVKEMEAQVQPRNRNGTFGAKGRVA